MNVLEMKDITKRFLAVTALKNVSLCLKQGEILAICGENGAGKSTLMKIISGSDPYGGYEGQLFMDGQEVKFHNVQEAREKGIEMIYQEISLHLDLTVAENLFLGSLPARKWGLIDWKAACSRAEEALAAVGLHVNPMQKVKGLSTSQQQLLAIARAIARKPRLLVLDEPTSALTQSEAENLLSILKKLREEGVSCLYISHKLKEIFELADRVAVIRDGEYISNYSIGDCTPEQLIEDMVGRKIDVLYPKVSAVQEQIVLQVENLCVPHPYRKGKNIVDGVSFSLKKGEVLGLSGLVGAGRSEVLEAIFKASTEGVTGEVYLEGSRIDERSLKQTKDAGIGFLTEDRKKSGIIAGGNIRMNTTLASLEKITDGFVINHKREQRLAEESVQKLNVKTPDLDTRIINLSGGNQQKVVLAKWMLTNLKVLLLDEPTRGIDVGAKVEIYKLMNQMVQQGISIIMVSSEMPELIAMCDRFLVLSEGQFRAEFSREEVTQEKIMKAIAITEPHLETA